MLARSCCSLASSWTCGLPSIQPASPWAVRLPPVPLSPAPCRVNSLMRMRVPSSRARRRPLPNSMPSTTERKARSLACRSPARLGAARVPLMATSAPSEPRSRQPGGASSDQTPMRGNCARNWPVSGASAGQSQPPTPCPLGGANQPRPELAVGRAGALAVPDQGQAQGVACGFERKAGLPDAGGHARRVALHAFGLHRDVAAAARQAGLELEGVAEHGIPLAVEHQVAAQAGACHLRAGQQFDPGNRQAGDLAGGHQFAGPPAHRLPGQRGLGRGRAGGLAGGARSRRLRPRRFQRRHRLRVPVST